MLPLLASAPAARLLSRTLLAMACGAAACGDGADEGAGKATPLGNTGSPHAAGSGGQPGLSGGGGAPAGSAGRSLGSAGRGDPSAPACEGGAHLVVDGRDSGLVPCADGGFARVAQGTCSLPKEFSGPGCVVDPASPGGGPVDASGGAGGACGAWCRDGSYGVFLNQRTAGFAHCRYHCEADADCPGGTVCICGADGVGMCGLAACTSAGDCGPGRACRVKTDARGCSIGLEVELVCYGPGDECLRDADCPKSTTAFPEGGPMRCTGSSVRVCQGPYACGRPILIADGALLAPLRRGPTDWSRGPARCVDVV